MNSLSLFVYFIGVVDKLNGAVGAIIFFGFIGVFVAAVGIVLAVAVTNDPDFPPTTRTTIKKWAAWYFAFYAIMLIFNAALPTRQTLILIAASEYGERVMKSDAVQGIVNPGMDLIKLWIKEETDKLLPKANHK